MNILHRKSCLLPTLPVSLIIIFGIIIIIYIIIDNIYPFLCVNEPVKSDYLVVEGWVPDYVLKDGLIEFRNAKYKYLIVTGDSLLKGASLSKSKTHAELAGEILLGFGFSRDSLIIISTSHAKKDRTYASAIAVNEWIKSSTEILTTINILTYSIHARRTRLTYEMAFNSKTKIGIIAVKSKSINPNAWWESSTGFRSVIYESLALFYTSFLFYPSG